MTFDLRVLTAVLVLAGAANAQPLEGAIPVTVDNFIRAESDLYFGNLTKGGSLGTFAHRREPAPIDHQTVIRSTATRSTPPPCSTSTRVPSPSPCRTPARASYR